MAHSPSTTTRQRARHPAYLASGAQGSGAGGFAITGTTVASRASDYSFIAPTIANAAAGITVRPLTITALDVTRSYGTPVAHLRYRIDGAGLVDGETLTGALASANATLDNVGRYAITQGSLTATGDYAVTYHAGEMTVTRRAVAQWTGGTSGNWFDPANWQDGAVPTLANVSQVLIPTNVTVLFDTKDTAPGVATGPVTLDSLGLSGGMTMRDGSLSVGAGGIRLAQFTQAGGTMESAGDVELASFTQTGGRTIAHGGFATSTGFAQGATGALAVGGSAAIHSTVGDVTLGNLTVAGDTSVTSTGGAITQATGTSMSVGGKGQYAAARDVTLGNLTIAGDIAVTSSSGTVSQAPDTAVAINGNAAIHAASGDVTLGNLTVAGDVAVTSTGGAIGQAAGTHLSVGGDGHYAATLNGRPADIRLANPGNDPGRRVSANGASVSLSSEHPLELEEVSATSDLNLVAKGGIRFGTTTTVGRNLKAVSTDGPITQAGTLAVAGTTAVDAGAQAVRLDNPANRFRGAITATSSDLAIAAASAITLGEVKTSGRFAVTSGSGSVSQQPGTTLTAKGGVAIDGAAGAPTSTTPFVVRDTVPRVNDQMTRQPERLTTPVVAERCTPTVRAASLRETGAMSITLGACGS